MRPSFATRVTNCEPTALKQHYHFADRDCEKINVLAETGASASKIKARRRGKPRELATAESAVGENNGRRARAGWRRGKSERPGRTSANAQKAKGLLNPGGCAKSRRVSLRPAAKTLKRARAAVKKLLEEDCSLKSAKRIAGHRRSAQKKK